MILPDVNILVNAHRGEAYNHERYKHWLADLIRGDEAYAMSDLVFSAFLRIVTNPKVFLRPTVLDDALTFVRQLRDQPHCVVVTPGRRHWDLFIGLCRSASARGNLVPDAYLAALAIESGSEWITEDGDYARFPGLRWRRPFG